MRQTINEETHMVVSVICTAYNQEAYIKDALDGFLMQKTSFPFEIIVHDDASTDNTAKIIREYEAKYPELFVNIYQKENQYSKNNGDVARIVFKAARGKYIAFCEGDDYWIDPLKLQKQVDFLDNNTQYGLIWTDINFYFQHSNKFKKAVFRSNILPIYDSFNEVLINKPYVAPCSWLLRSDCLKNDPNNYCDGSFAILLDVLSTKKIKYLDEVTTVYRMLENSASHSKSLLNRYQRSQGVYKIQKDYCTKYNLSKELEGEIDLRHYKYVYPLSIILNKYEDIKNGRIILKRSMSIGIRMRLFLFLSNYNFAITIFKFFFNFRENHLR